MYQYYRYRPKKKSIVYRKVLDALLVQWFLNQPEQTGELRKDNDLLSSGNHVPHNLEHPVNLAATNPVIQLSRHSNIKWRIETIIVHIIIRSSFAFGVGTWRLVVSSVEVCNRDTVLEVSRTTTFRTFAIVFFLAGQEIYQK